MADNPTLLVATWAAGLFALNRDQWGHELANQTVRGLAPDGRGGALAIVGSHAVMRRAPSGQWSTVVTSEQALSCCMAVKDVIYAGTDDARLLRLSDQGGLVPLESFDHVPGRESWFAGSAIVNGQRVGPPLGIRSVAANALESILLANVHVGGIPRSSDGGKTWHPTLPIACDVHEVRAHVENPALFAAAAAVGLCISRDAGATWTIERAGLHAPHCSALAFVGDDVLVSASSDPFVPQGRIYRKSLAVDGPLMALTGGMPAWTAGIVDTGCISANGPFVAVADRGGNVHTSADFGRNWSCRRSGLPAPSGVLVC